MRPLWTGGISFGLIYIPVKLYSATQEIQLDLDFLSQKDLAPIRYAKIDSKTGKEVAWKDVVKGYEYKKGDYVLLTDEDFEKVDMEKSKNIDIQCFVDADEIDPILFDKPYYIEPDKKAYKTYVLLKEALKKSNKVGVSEFVFRNREHLGVLKAEGNMLILNQMRYSNEIRSTEDLDIPRREKLNKDEVEIAVELINKMSATFDPSEYKDDYIAGLKRVIEAKVKHKPFKAKSTPVKHEQVADLMTELKKSLETVEVKK